MDDQDRHVARVHSGRPAIPRLAPGHLALAWLMVGTLTAAVLGISLGTRTASGQAIAQIPEESVKAAYLYKFASYVDWPESASSRDNGPIEIGVLGAPALATQLVAVTAGRTVDNRAISVRQVADGDLFEGLHILFVGDQRSERLREILAPARFQPILTVTESAGALDNGSVINFTINDQRIRFEVALYAAEENRLRLSARLLAVAERVYRTPE